MKRAGGRGEGKWERISWPEALKTVAEGLLKVKEQYGAKGVAFGVGMPKGLDHFIQIRLANLFGSPNIIASQDVCHAPARDHGRAHLRLLPRGGPALREQARRPLGKQHHLHQRGRRDLQHADEADQGRHRDHRHRPAADRSGQEGQALAPAAAGHGLGACPGVPQRHHRGRALRQGVRREVDPRLRRAGRPCESLQPGKGLRDHLGAGRYHPPGRPRPTPQPSPRRSSGETPSSTTRRPSRRRGP